MGDAPERIWLDTDMQPWRVWIIEMADLPEYVPAETIAALRAEVAHADGCNRGLVRLCAVLKARAERAEAEVARLRREIATDGAGQFWAEKARQMAIDRSGLVMRAEAAEAELTAARAARTAKVKPLVWEEWDEVPVQVFSALTILGRYKVQKRAANPGWMVVFPSGNITSRDTETAAKAAAQADYEARILAALDMGDAE